MILKTLAIGELGTNCYIIGCEETKVGAIIDPGAKGDYLVRVIQSMDLKIEYIINTHGHIDHIGANNIVKEATGAKLLIHHLDAPMLTDSTMNLASFLGVNALLSKPDQILENGDIIKVGKLELEVIHTPGHTLGGICLKVGQEIFTGDTLFAGSVGRTDLPGGNSSTLIQSIEEKLMVFDDKITIYPGHGPSSTIGDERRSNPFL